MEILSPGEKLKKIRKEYGISQKKLTQGIISITMLSYIENDKLLMSEKISAQLCNRLCEMAGNTILTPQELFYTKEEQTKKIIETIIKNLSNYSIEEFKEAKIPIDKYTHSNETIKFNAIVGSYIYNKFQTLGDALFFLESVLEDAVVTNSNFLPMIILQLQRGYNKSNHWKKTINLFKNINFNKIKEKEIKGYILFNFGLAFHKKQNYEKALEIYKESYSLLKKQIAKESCLNNAGYCYILKKNFSEAIDYFLFSLKKNDSPYNTTLCYSNLILCGIETNNLTLIKTTIPKLEKSIELVSKDKKYQSYMCLGKGYSYLNDRYNSMINYEKELELGLNITGHHFLIDKYIFTIIQLLKIYESYDLDRLKKLEKYIYLIPKEAILPEEILEIIDIVINKFPLSHSKNLIMKLKEVFKD